MGWSTVSNDVSAGIVETADGNVVVVGELQVVELDLMTRVHLLVDCRRGRASERVPDQPGAFPVAALHDHGCEGGAPGRTHECGACCSGMAPLVTPKKVETEDQGIQAILPLNMCVKMLDFEVVEDKYMAASLNYRGEVQGKEANSTGVVPARHAGPHADDGEEHAAHQRGVDGPPRPAPAAHRLVLPPRRPRLRARPRTPVCRVPAHGAPR